MSGSRRGVPVVQQTEQIQQQPVVRTEGGGTMAALSRTFSDLSSTFARFGEDERRRAEIRQAGQDQEEILTRPMRDEAGNYTVPEPGDWGTQVGQARNRLILNRLSDEAQVEARERAVTMRQEAGNDPARFAEAWRGYTEGRLQAMPEWVREQARGSFVGVGNQHFQSMQQHVLAREERNQQAGWAANIQMQQQEMEGLVRAGRMDSPEYRVAQNSWSALLERGVREGHLSREAADVQRHAQADQVASLGATRIAMDRLASGATNEEVLRDIDREFDRLAVPINQRERLRNLVESRINERRAVQAEQRSEIGVEWTDMRARLTGGVAVPAAEVDDLARRAEGANARATAAEIRRTQEVYSDLRDAGTVSLPELQRRQAAMVQQVATNPNATSRQAILAEMLGQAVTRRREAMRNDPLGTAALVHRNNPDGGALVALDFSSLEALGAGLATRAQQARRLGALEGMAETMPVLTAPEAAQLSTIVRTGTRDQQVALLNAFTRLPADTMRRTMEGLLPGTETERDPRVLSFMAAAGLTQRDPRLALEVVNGQERLRAMPAPALNSPEVDRFIERQIGEAYGVNPAAFASLRAAARAVYAERAGTGFDPSQPGSRNDPALSGRFDSGLMERVLRQVAPTIRFQGQTIPPPLRDGRLMTEAEFTEQMRAIPAHVLAGARAENNAPITPDMVRRNGTLVAKSEGRYELQIAGYPVNGADGRRFVLDLRRPWPEAPAAGDPGAPRGIRNNNPLNLEFRQGQPGVQGSDGRFGRYGSMEDGLHAGARQILSWVDRGDTTLTALITRWAPPSENNTAAYIQRVARDTGLNPNTPLNWRDPDVLGSVMQSMARHENGQEVDTATVRRAAARATS